MLLMTLMMPSTSRITNKFTIKEPFCKLVSIPVEVKVLLGFLNTLK